jgi:hypothetical protein
MAVSVFSSASALAFNHLPTAQVQVNAPTAAYRRRCISFPQPQ